MCVYACVCVQVDSFVVVLPDSPTHKNNTVTVYLQSGTNVRVLYQMESLEPNPNVCVCVCVCSVLVVEAC